MSEKKLEQKLKMLGYTLDIEKFINGSPYQRLYGIYKNNKIIYKGKDLNDIEDWILEKTYFNREA